jgi:hypothetical protein
MRRSSRSPPHSHVPCGTWPTLQEKQSERAPTPCWSLPLSPSNRRSRISRRPPSIWVYGCPSAQISPTSPANIQLTALQPNRSRHRDKSHVLQRVAADRGDALSAEKDEQAREPVFGLVVIVDQPAGSAPSALRCRPQRMGHPPGGSSLGSTR